MEASWHEPDFFQAPTRRISRRGLSLDLNLNLLDLKSSLHDLKVTCDLISALLLEEPQRSEKFALEPLSINLPPLVCPIV